MENNIIKKEVISQTPHARMVDGVPVQLFSIKTLGDTYYILGISFFLNEESYFNYILLDNKEFEEEPDNDRHFSIFIETAKEYINGKKR